MSKHGDRPCILDCGNLRTAWDIYCEGCRSGIDARDRGLDYCGACGETYRPKQGRKPGFRSHYCSEDNKEAK